MNKEKTIVTESPNVHALVPKARKAQTVIPLSEPISFIFEKLISLEILQTIPRENHLHSFNLAK